MRLVTLIRLTTGVAAALLAGAVSTAAAPQSPPSRAIAVIPRPVRVVPRAGRFRLTPRTTIWTDQASEGLGHQLARYLEPSTGFTLRVRISRAVPSRGIVLRRDARLARLGHEGYTLDVGRSRVLVRAPHEAGAFYALQTIRQLLPPEIFRQAKVAPASGAWDIPAVTIEDYPRFAWRGAHLDVGRHFMPTGFVKKYIDLLALHKMNTFHWHLTEDQGWRLEIKKYPKLTEVGAWRKETIVGNPQRDPAQWTFDGERHGGYYTQDDVREVVAYANARFVTVVPEIEMPGHAVAAIAAYPSLGVTGLPMEVATRWGVFDDILNAEPATIAFMQDVLSEVLALFPGPYIHIGGDEAAKAKWHASPAVQARIQALGVGDERGLQSWFIRQMDAFLTAHGRRLVGWDEILEGGLAPNATVMSWRGTQGGIDAARAGHDVVMAPNSHTYFDHYQSRDTSSEPIAIGGFLPIETVYAYDPVPAGLSPADARHVLGAQGQLWTEYMKDPRKVEYMAFPRMCALAEVVWTRAALKDYADFTARLGAHLGRLEALDVNVRRP
jgi:hexosaminidase